MDKNELRKTYKFQGQELYQEELTLKEDFKLLMLIKKLNINTMEDFAKFSIVDVIEKFYESKIIIEALNIILKPADAVIDFMQLKNSELEEVLTDFFTLNPSVSKRLLNTKLVQDLTKNLN